MRLAWSRLVVDAMLKKRVLSVWPSFFPFLLLFLNPRGVAHMHTHRMDVNCPAMK